MKQTPTTNFIAIEKKKLSGKQPRVILVIVVKEKKKIVRTK